ncbi:aliphatic sulfonate ABC transporter substrate-binding protein [Nocardioides okcheonensis]|uniref:aliphatic sulfonate ABC transporter substrate-binding protein n=1 Tax=Nocardioides okcheonensis TaxID=2894081 RepID=UPI0022A781F1|nr:aliphatic sulfonate ABC transporter substrate-binding protein [Nocardioides okcheonensis]
MPVNAPSLRLRGAAVGTLLLAATTLTGCAAGEDAAQAADDTVVVDYATYNPLSLVIKDQGWLDDALAEDGTSVQWVKSEGSNDANEKLRAEAIDVGSTAGSAALLARANGSPIHTVDVFSQPEWSAIVVPQNSRVDDLTDLEGGTVAATLGTDPYFFLLQALDEAGVDPDTVTVENLQHADGAAALAAGRVDAWAGLDPMMAAAEQDGARLLYRNVDFNTYGFLNVTEDFLADDPETVQLIVDVYDHAREWVAQNPDEAVAILAEEAAIDEEVARTVLTERTTLDGDHVPGADQLAVLERVGPVFVENGDVDEQASIDTALEELFDTTFAEKADATRVS